MKDKNMNNSYVIITPARNEEAYIEKTFQSVISQTILPKKWVIVSDGSTDRTDEIVKLYESNYDFIQLLHREPDTSRSFASKVYAIRAGIKQLNGIEYDFIGNLDADVSFEPDYYESVFVKFQENPKLGIAGGELFDNCGGKYIRQLKSTSWSVGGPVQMFRRKCYEDIGGYIPIKLGCEDAIAEIMARMHGWEVKSFPDIRVMHHRRTGTEKGNILSARFRGGVMDYSLGYSPLFEVARCFLRIIEKPYVIGSLFRICGYCWAFLRRDKQILPDEIVKFFHKEQLDRLISTFIKCIGQ